VAQPAAAAAPEAPPACSTLADVLTTELPDLKLSPVFRRLYGSPNLKVGASIVYESYTRYWGHE
jgi:hypothetical protein